MLSPFICSVSLGFLVCHVYAATFQNTSAFDVFKYVDQLIGTDNGGNVFAGATLPYGMAKAVADVDGQNTAGFSTDGSNVTGFSHMHDSGTGGNPSLGNFPLFPQHCPGDELDNCKFPIAARKVPYVNESVVASPGYFSLDLQNGIAAEMTVTEHTALYRFSFPPDDTQLSPISPLIMLDLTDLSASRQNASVSVNESGRMIGNGTFLPSFGGGSFVLYFCADFSGGSIRDTGIWVNDRAGNSTQNLFVPRGINLYYIEAGSFIRFHALSGVNSTIDARVGVSFISADKACQNAESEIPGPNWDFAGIRSNAEQAWRRKLSTVSVVPGGADDSLQTSFWSAIYRTMMSPQDYSGENPLWESSEPYFDSFYW